MPHFENATEASAVWRQPAEMWRWMAKVGTTITGSFVSPLTTKGDIWGFDTADNRIPVGANNTVLTADSGQALGVKWASGAVSPLTTKGDVWGFSSVDARIPIGSNGQVLTADSAQTLGLKWATPSAGTTSPLTTKGDVWGFSSVDARVPVGSNNQVLTADSTQTLGVKWATPATFTNYWEFGGVANQLALASANVTGIDDFLVSISDSRPTTAQAQIRATLPTLTTTPNLEVEGAVDFHCNDNGDAAHLTAAFFASPEHNPFGTVLRQPTCGLSLDSDSTGQAGPIIEFRKTNVTPDSPGNNLARFYAKLTGGGKMQFVALFPSGAEQVIATEP